MSNAETNAFLKVGFPPGCKLSGTAHAVNLLLCHRYDTRAGQGKSYPGMAELMRATGKSRQTVQEALADLLKAGYITQVQKGYRKHRAEYVPCYAVSLVQLGRHSVGYSVTNELEVSAIPADSVSNTDLMGQPYQHKVSGKPYTISTINTDKYDKYDSHNSVRFDLILSGLKAETKALIKPSKKCEVLLDELEHQGTSLEAIRKWITDTDFSTAHKVGGLFMYRLNALGRPVKVQPTRTTQPPAFSHEEQRPLNPPTAKIQALLDQIGKRVPPLDYNGSTEIQQP